LRNVTWEKFNTLNVKGLALLSYMKYLFSGNSKKIDEDEMAGQILKCE
jgi:hypothetical protein